jgi:hypothetical protein
VGGYVLNLEYVLYVNNGVCLPVNMSEYANVENWNYIGSWPNHEEKFSLPFTYQRDDVEEEILTNIGNLSNNILASAAAKKLTRFEAF